MHDNWKQAVVAAAETDTVIVNRFARPAMRTLRTELSAAAERERTPAGLSIDGVMDLYFGGSMEAAYAMSGQVAGRITRCSRCARSSRRPGATAGTGCSELGKWAEE